MLCSPEGPTCEKIIAFRPTRAAQSWPFMYLYEPQGQIHSRIFILFRSFHLTHYATAR
jgi:hypothetical protein